MATVITHAFAGAVCAMFGPRRLSKIRLAPWLAAAAVLPDLDVFAQGVPYGHPLGHRGFSHSIAFAAITAFFAALFVTRIAARGIDMKKKDRIRTMLVCFLAVMSHGFLDALTDAGMGVGFFIPFSRDRYFFPWRPVMTASLSPSSFFTMQTLLVLNNEISRIWLPLIGVTVIGRGVRMFIPGRSSF